MHVCFLDGTILHVDESTHSSWNEIVSWIASQAEQHFKFTICPARMELYVRGQKIQWDTASSPPCGVSEIVSKYGPLDTIHVKLNLFILDERDVRLVHHHASEHIRQTNNTSHQTTCTLDDARRALRTHHGDLVDAIYFLTNTPICSQNTC